MMIALSCGFYDVKDQSRKPDISCVLARPTYDSKPIYGVSVPRKAGSTTIATPSFIRNFLDDVEPGSLRHDNFIWSLLKVYLHIIVLFLAHDAFLDHWLYALAGTVFSVTTSTRTTVRPPAATIAKAAIPRVLKPASPPTATDVKNSIVNWETSVNTVNDYLVRHISTSNIYNCLSNT
ncbi:hypothetical protein V8E51_005562 [Hyaloscypha variabilis]